MRVVLGALLAAVLATAPAVPVQGAGQELLGVVILTRHGVRAPTRDPAPLAPSRPWGAWPVLNYGDLTTHGEDLMRRFGVYYRNQLISDGLFAAPSCFGWRQSIYVYADTDQRTLRSAEGLLSGIGPLCGLPYHSKAGGDDPIFSAPHKAKRIANGPQLQSGSYKAAMDELRAVLGCCALNGPQPLRVASTAAELFQLQYAQGTQVAWGRAGPDPRKFLNDVIALHVLYSAVNVRSPAVARTEGSNLASHISATLLQIAGRGAPHFTAAYKPPASSKVVVLVGHDANLSLIGGLLGLTWAPAGFVPNDAPAGSSLAFELHRCNLTDVCVRVVFRSQTLEFMRNPSGRAAVVTANVAIPDCPGTCTLARFRALVAQKVDVAEVRL